MLIGSMNPEEGELRPQLLDRFGLAVDVRTSTGAHDRALAVRRRIAFDADPAGVGAEFAPREDGLRRQLAAHARSARSWSVPPELMRSVSSLCAAVGAEGLRADLVICPRVTDAALTKSECAIVAKMGFKPAFLFNAMSFLFSALSISRLRMEKGSFRPAKKSLTENDVVRPWHEYVEGLRYMRSNPLIFGIGLLGIGWASGGLRVSSRRLPESSARRRPRAPRRSIIRSYS